MINYTFLHNVGVCSFVSKWTKRRSIKDYDYPSYRVDGYVLQSKYGQIYNHVSDSRIRYNREAQAFLKQDII